MNNLFIPMYKILVRVLLIIVVASGFLFNSLDLQGTKVEASTSGATTLSIEPVTKNVSAGDTFTLNVLVAPATAIAGAQFNLSYDPAVLQINSVTEGGLLKQNGNTSFFLPGDIDNTEGLLKNVAGAITTSGGEVSEEGVLATVTFTAKASGTSTLTLSNVIAGSKVGQSVPVQVIGGSVTVQGGTSSESVSGVSLDKTSCSLTVGETGQLTATVQPVNASNKNVTWSSDNEAVATVDATGKVTAVSAGTANITVTTADGGFTATCAVTIATGSVTIVGIDPATKTVSAGDTFELDVLITPATAIAGAQFNLSYDPAVLQVNSVTEGGLLKQNGNTSFFLTGVIDNNSGLLNNVAGAITTPGGEVSGEGSLAVISFTAKATGTSTLALSNVIAANKAAQAVPVQVNGGSVTVQGGTSSEPVSGVSLDQTSYSLAVGETGQLTATVAPANASNKNVTWTSDNEAVATVDATGKVTAVSAGTANITVTTADGGFTATCAVTVQGGASSKPVSGVSLDKTSDSLTVGETGQLTATVQPADASNKDVTWSSDNEAVATVDATGKVTAVSVGTANITVTTADGGFTDTCVITVPQVVNLDPDSNSIAVTNNPMEVNVPKDVANPQITVTPSSGGSFTMPQVKVKADTSLGTVSVGISAGTQITGPANWNGIIELPHVLLNNAVTVTPSSGKTATVEAVVEIGASNDAALTFDHAVRLLIPGMAGKQAGYVRGGVFQKIETLCEQDSQEWSDSNLPAEGAGKIDVNGDLVIWTKHFTKFVTYTETAVGGGGGGGGGGSSTTTPSVQTSEAAGITESSATLNGSITSSGGSTVTSYGFVWGTDQNNLDKKVQVGTDNHSGSFQTNLSGLTAGTTYYFKAYAVNSKGTKQGAIKQFTAAAQQPSVEVTSPNGTPSNVKSFSDVANSHWAYNAISQLSKNGLVNGYPDGTFRPDREMSRAEFVTVLSKALQLPDYKPAASTFGDVAASDWYAGAVETVVHAGIISGYGNGSFGPNDSVTREQASVILVKALGKNNEAAAKMLDSTGFTDDTAISSWARGFVVAAEEQNLLKGYPDSTFRPQQNMTRAEICTVIKNLLDTKSQSEN
jgi:uncharacterized protein YjdB